MPAQAPGSVRSSVLPVTWRGSSTPCQGTGAVSWRQRTGEAGDSPWELQPAVCIGGLLFSHSVFSQFLDCDLCWEGTAFPPAGPSGQGQSFSWGPAAKQHLNWERLKQLGSQKPGKAPIFQWWLSSPVCRVVQEMKGVRLLQAQGCAVCAWGFWGSEVGHWRRRKAGREVAVWQSLQGARHCTAALCCEEALAQRGLAAWRLGGFALIKVTALQPHLHPFVTERRAVMPVELLHTLDFKPINC